MESSRHRRNKEERNKYWTKPTTNIPAAAGTVSRTRPSPPPTHWQSCRDQEEVYGTSTDPSTPPKNRDHEEGYKSWTKFIYSKCQRQGIVRNVTNIAGPPPCPRSKQFCMSKAHYYQDFIREILRYKTFLGSTEP